MYERTPPTLLPYVPGTTIIEAVNQELKSRDIVIRELHDQLHEAQQCMKKYYDAKRIERNFEVGDFLYFLLQPYRQVLMAL